MPAVETVLGPVELESMGRTLFHEHLVIRDEAVAAQFPHLNDPAGLDTMIAAVAHVHELGIDAVIDPTVAGLGLDVGFLRTVSEATGVQALAGTGYFTTSELPPYFALRSPDELADAPLLAGDGGFSVVCCSLPDFGSHHRRMPRGGYFAPSGTRSCWRARSGRPRLDRLQSRGRRRAYTADGVLADHDRGQEGVAAYHLRGDRVVRHP